MAINKNHLFDDLNGVKCAIVESNTTDERVNFIKPLLEYNGYTVIVVPMPPAKVAPAVPPSPTTENVVSPVISEVPPQPTIEKFIIGVTHVSFNVTNAIFGRLLHTPDGHFVTMAYWMQEEKVSRDDIPYFDK